MAQQKDYKVLVMQKVMVPDFAFHKNIGWGIFDYNFFLGVWEFKKKLIFKSSNAQSKGVSRKEGGVCWKEGVEASNCLKQLSTSICWPQREKYLIVFASEARPTFSTVMQADMEKGKTSK